MFGRIVGNLSIPSATSAPQHPMKRLLILGLTLAAQPPLQAQPPTVHCPGETTVEMRFCAAQSWEESEGRLRPLLSKQLQQQWQQATRAVCARAYAPYSDGTIYPQLVVGCDDRLNRALLQEFQPLNN